MSTGPYSDYSMPLPDLATISLGLFNAVLLGDCGNWVDRWHLGGAFAVGVEGNEHTLEAGARYREHQQVRRRSIPSPFRLFII